MWTRGSGRRPPKPPRGPGGRPAIPRIDLGRPATRVQQVSVAETRAASPLWRKWRRRIKAVWRWMVVRTIRGWMGRFAGRPERPESPAQQGAIRQFPNGR